MPEEPADLAGEQLGRLDRTDMPDAGQDDQCGSRIPAWRACATSNGARASRSPYNSRVAHRRWQVCSEVRLGRRPGHGTEPGRIELPHADGEPGDGVGWRRFGEHRGQHGRGELVRRQGRQLQTGAQPFDDYAGRQRAGPPGVSTGEHHVCGRVERRRNSSRATMPPKDSPTRCGRRVGGSESIPPGSRRSRRCETSPAAAPIARRRGRPRPRP